jgi:DNA-binding HxlR family transcriptional regulator
MPVEYAITPLGHSLRQPFEALCGWALAHGGEIDEAGSRYDNAQHAA